MEISENDKSYIKTCDVLNMENYNEKQLKVFNELKEWIASEGFKCNFYGSQDDSSIMKFCKARKFDLEKCIAFFKTVLKNRMHYNFHKIAKHFFINEEKTARWLKLKSIWKSGYHGQSVGGMPVWFDILAEYETAKDYINIFSNKEILSMHVYENYRCNYFIYPYLSKKFGYNVCQTIVCMDMRNFGFYSLGGNERTTITHVSNFMKDSYPENMYRNMVINAPMLARTAYNVTKYVLDEGTRLKVSVSGDNFMKKMQEHMLPEWIPDFLGGTSPFFDPTDGQIVERGMWTEGVCLHPKDQYQYFLDRGLEFGYNEDDFNADLEKLKDVPISIFELDPAQV